MYIAEVFKCDVCGAEHTSNNGFYLIRLEDTGARKILVISDFDPVSARITPAVCGENCLQKLVSSRLVELRGYSA